MDAPSTLGDAGAALWRLVIDDVPDDKELDAKELHLLESVCHVRDQIAALDAAVAADGEMITGARGTPLVHPGLQEARQLRAVELRMLREIGKAPASAQSVRAQHAASVRHLRAARS